MTASNVKSILATIPKGTTLSVNQIQNLVQTNYNLTPADWAKYTTTRKTNYPKWHHTIQSVLAEYKKNGTVIHHPDQEEYTF